MFREHSCYRCGLPEQRLLRRLEDIAADSAICIGCLKEVAKDEKTQQDLHDIIRGRSLYNRAGEYFPAVEKVILAGSLPLEFSGWTDPEDFQDGQVEYWLTLPCVSRVGQVKRKDLVASMAGQKNALPHTIAGLANLLAYGPCERKDQVITILVEAVRVYGVVCVQHTEYLKTDWG